ncbi:uncharacterized protein ACB057_005988 [Neosynchiropus ocellatus]
MGKGFFVSKGVAAGLGVLAVAAVATIIALSVVYAQEKANNNNGTVSPTDAPVEPTSPPSNELWDQYRLPKSLVPLTYNLTLWPRLTPNATTGLYIFTGDSTVDFECVEETDLILIHSNKLHYTLMDGQMARLVALTSGAKAPAIVKSWEQNVTQYLVLQLDGKLTKTHVYQLHTVFTGELADDLGGFYRSEYMEGGVKKVVATTQMQPTDARKAFPCFDEPAMKAVFHITLIHARGTVALSNGQERESREDVVDGQNVLRTVFDPTEKMSTYLLAFIVSEFGHIRNEVNDVAIRIFARKPAIDAGQGAYALNITGPILKYFQDYYNSTYPLPKSDQIALPDFNAGAMENWGLITYRETALLYDESFSSNSNKERIASIISHELAHMWFGNLVTLRWWNDLWLNEGFASYVEYLGADHAEPDWNVKDLIVLGDVHRVFAIDALASSHPLSSKEEDIQKPAQISELFDAISYSKGASVLRMLSDFLTEEVFTQGLKTYLEAFQFGNTVYTDLWDHLQKAVPPATKLPATVHDIMDRWVLQMGFPVVKINTANGEVTQQHFLLNPNSSVTVPSDFKYEWIVPIKWVKTGAPQTEEWLVNKSMTITAMKASGSDWVLANTDVVGYYRVNYDEQNWERLLGVLATKHTDIRVINRAQLVDDAFNLARAKHISTILALKTTQYLSRERDYLPWKSALNNLDFFYLMFDRSEVYGPMQDYLRKQVTPLFNYYKDMTGNWSDVPKKHMDQYNQVTALSLACRTGLDECQTLAKTWFGAWMSTGRNPIHPNLRSTVYCNAIAAGGAAEWDFAWEQFQSASIAIEADKLRAALACATQPWLLNRYLEYTLDPTKVRKQDATSTIVYVANNVVGQSLAWDFIRAHWTYIFTEYGGGSFSFSNLINGVTERFSTEFELQQLHQFKEDHAEEGFGSGTLAVEQSIERTVGNMRWIQENQMEVQAWFEEQAKPSSHRGCGHSLAERLATAAHFCFSGLQRHVLRPEPPQSRSVASPTDMAARCRVSKLRILCSVLALVSVATIVTLWTLALTGGDDVTAPWDRYRLPAALVPRSYNITLWPRLTPDPSSGRYIFTGSSLVEFQCVRQTDLILLHSNKLHYTLQENQQLAALVASGGGPAPGIRSSWLQNQTQLLVLQLRGPLTEGQTYRLISEFAGELADDLAGFYRSEYQQDGVRRVVAASQMHPTHARKTFPCFDEPAMKAVFRLTLLHPPGTVALSNGLETGQWSHVVNTTVDGVALTRTTFQPTKRMSTYLLAVVVSDFAHVGSRQGDTLVRIWARKKAIRQGQGDYALNVTGPVLDFFQRYYNISYPLSKTDQIALPDFYFGAMENWGLVTYRETNLLYSPETSSNRNRQTTATIVAHELAHMWFGNLVTLRWWNEVWLNEGFASYVAYLGADRAEPDWDLKDLILLDDIHRVFAVDALVSSHPLSSDEDSVVLPEQISEQFDAISYSKGAAVLRMLSDFLSEPVFVQGLSTYLDHFAYNNTVGSDLWRHLQLAVEANKLSLPRRVEDIMNRWVLQMGFPVVTVDTASGAVSQSHFLLDPGSDVAPESPYRYEWMVPVRWTDQRSGGAQKELWWLLGKTDVNEEMRGGDGGWVLANINVTGYYRVNYDLGNWERLLGQLRDDHQAIPPLNRAQLVDDAFHLARAQLLSTTLALRSTAYLSEERDYVPWQSALDNLEYYYLMLDQTEVYGPMQEYLRRLVTPLFLHFKVLTSNWTEIPLKHTDQYNQVNAVRTACETGVPECLALTSAWFRRWMEEPERNTIHPNLRAAVYCSAVADGGAPEWDFVWLQLEKAALASEASELMGALACSRDTRTLQRYLSYALDPAVIRKQDATSVITSVASNRAGQRLAWDFVRTNWNYMFTDYGAGSFAFASVIGGVTARFSTPAQLRELEEFVEEHGSAGFGSASLAVEQALERTRTNIQWLQRNRQLVSDWFAGQAGL